jgi:hypothetical protein
MEKRMKKKLLKLDNPWWKTFSFKEAPFEYFLKQ